MKFEKVKKQNSFFIILAFLIANNIVNAENEKIHSLHNDLNSFPACITTLKIYYDFQNRNKNLIQETLNNTREQKIVNDDYKSPWLAFGLALMFPGLGQVYNGEYGKLGIIYGTAGIGAGMAIFALANSSYGTSNPEPSYVAPIGIAGVSIISLAWIYSIIDAPISANSLNDLVNQKTAFHKSILKNNSYSIDISTGIVNEKLNLELIFMYQL